MSPAERLAQMAAEIDAKIDAKLAKCKTDRERSEALLKMFKAAAAKATPTTE